MTTPPPPPGGSAEAIRAGERLGSVALKGFGDAARKEPRLAIITAWILLACVCVLGYAYITKEVNIAAAATQPGVIERLDRMEKRFDRQEQRIDSIYEILTRKPGG